MCEEKKPYFANARVGDRVVHVTKGTGFIKDTRDIPYSIVVQFDDPLFLNYAFTVDGFHGQDKRQALYYAGTTFTVNDAGEPKRTKKVTVFVDFYKDNEAFWHKEGNERGAPDCILEAVPVEIEVPEDLEI